jgi:TRAP transporter TAXI family solute receptor
MTGNRGGSARRGWLAAAALALCALPACQRSTTPPPQTGLVLGTVFPGGSWDVVGRALATAYNKSLSDVTVTVQNSENLETHVDSLEQGRIAMAIEDAETAYLAYSSGTQELPKPHRELRAIAVLFSTAVHVVARRDAHLTSVSDLAGKRVVVGQKGTSTERAARLILESHGVAWDAVERIPSVEHPTEALRSGRVDAQFIYAPFPNPVISELLSTGDAELIPMERRRIGAIQERHHFLKSTTIARDTYRNLEDDLLTVGMDVLLLCRADLPDPLVYDLAKNLFASVPALALAHAAAGNIDPERGPTATIPLHPGAARYYREREILK